MKTLFRTLIILSMLLVAASCNQYRFIPIPFPDDDATPYDVSSAKDLEDMLNTTGQARLMSDLELTTQLPPDSSYNIDLNNHQLSFDLEQPLQIGANQKVTIENGSLDILLPLPENPSATTGGINLNEGSYLTLDGVSYVANQTGIVTDDSSVTINVRNSEITAEKGFAISTNAGQTPPSSNVVINIENSALYSPKSASVLQNLGESFLYITNSHIEGSSQAVIVRGGTAEIKDSTLIATGYDDEPSWYEGYINSTWEEGNGMPFGALIVGDLNNNDYNYGEINCTAENVSLSSLKEGGFNVFVSSDEGVAGESEIKYTSVSLTIDNEYVEGIKGEGHHKGANTTITVNGESL